MQVSSIGSRRMRARRVCVLFSASQAAAMSVLALLSTARPAVAVTTFTTTTTAAGNWSTGANWGGTAPTGNQAGNIAKDGAATETLTLDVATTLGQIQDTNSSGRSFTIDASGSVAMTMDNTGGVANPNSTSDFSAFIGSTSSGGVTFQPNIVISNTNLDFYLNGSTSPTLTVGVSGGSNTITATTAQTLYTIADSGGSGGITINSSIGATGSTITVDNTGTGVRSLTIAGALGAHANVTQDSSTSGVTLSNANTNYSGTTNVLLGTLTTTAATPLGTVVVGGSSTSGTLTLNGGVNAVYTVTGLALGSGAANGNGTINNASTTNTATLVFTSGTTEYDGLIENSGGKALALTVNSGALTLNGGGNTYSGLTTINGGALTINGESALGGANYAGLTFGSNGGTLSYESGLSSGLDITQNSGGTAQAVTLTGNGTINIPTSESVAFAKAFGGGGTGGLTKTGSGNLTLGGLITYTGNTTISGGTLLLSGSTVTTLASPTVTIGSGATLDVTGLSGSTFNLANTHTLQGSGAVNGTVSAAGGSIIQPGTASSGSGGSGSLTFSSLTLATGAKLNFGLSASNSFNSFVSVGSAGVLTFTGGSLTLNLYTPNANTPFAAAGTYELFQYTTMSGTPSFTLGTSIAGFTAAYGTVAGSGSFSGTTFETLTLSASGTAGVWTNGNSDGIWAEGPNWSTNPSFPQNPGDTATFNNTATPGTVTLSAPETVGGLTFNTTSGSYTIAGPSTLTLDNSGSGAAVVDDSGAQSISAPISLNDNTTITVAGGVQLTVSSNISSTGTAQTLAINGAGTTVLSGSNSYGPLAGTVGTTLSGGGTVRLGNNSALSTGDVSVTGPVVLQAGASAVSILNNIVFPSAQTLTLDSNGDSFTLSGNINDGATGAAVSVVGSGTVILSGSGNSYSGGTTLNNGTLQIASDANLGASAGTVTFNGGALQLGATIASSSRNYVIDSGKTAIIDTQSNSLTESGIISSVGATTGSAMDGLTKYGSGTLILSGSNTYTGETLINNGTLVIGAALTIQNSTVNVGVNGTLAAGTGTASVAALAGSGSVVLSGATVLSLGNTNATGANTGDISGNGSVTKLGTGTQSLSNANFTGNIFANGGYLNISGGSFGSSTSTITVGNGAIGFLAISGGTAQATTLSVGANSGGSAGSSASVTGTATGTFGTVYIGSNSNTGGALTINTTAGTTTLGVVNVNRDGTGSTANPAGGLIIAGGNAVATSVNVEPSAHEGDVNVTGGTLTIGNSLSSGSFQIATAVNNNGYLTMNNGSLTYLGTDGLLAGDSSNTTAIAISGGTATLTGITLNDHTGTGTYTLNVSGGTLVLGSAGLVLNNSGTTSATFGTATIGAFAPWSSSAPITLAGNTTFQPSDSSNNPQNITLSGGLSGTGSLTVSGTGVVTLESASLYSGGTVVKSGTLTGIVSGAFGSGTVSVNPTLATSSPADNATLNVNADGAIATTAAVTVNSEAADAPYGVGALNFNDAAPVIGSLAGIGNVVLANTSGTALTVGNATSTVFSGVISDTSSGQTSSFTKAGSGALTLSGPNTYGGGTTINAGTLYVNNTTGSGTGSGPVTLAGGTLGGIGTFSGNLTSSGGTLFPGPSARATGILHAGGSVTLNSSATFTVALTPNQTTTEGVDGDVLVLTNATGVFSAAGATLQIVPIGFPSVGPLAPADTYTIVDATANSTGGVDSTLFSNLTLESGSTYAYSSGAVTADVTFNSDTITVQLDSVPEPGCLGLLSLGGLGLLRRRRRRRMEQAAF